MPVSSRSSSSSSTSSTASAASAPSALVTIGMLTIAVSRLPAPAPVAAVVPSAARWSCPSPSTRAPLPVEPHPQQRHQLVGVDRLGHVVGGAGVDALLAVALHR